MGRSFLKCEMHVFECQTFKSQIFLQRFFKSFLSLKNPLTSHILAKLNILFTTTNSFPIINFSFTVYWRLI